ncbi:MAG: FAD binding domain-containing protein [Planctomycetota bacterium]
MRDHLRLMINGRPVEVRGADVFLPLATFLRKRRGLPGTKVVCAEGDCGSCSVFIGRPVDGEMRYTTVTSCIALMLQLDATHIVTVEGLTPGDELSPIQDALVKCQGTQCGFCTPGFVVAMTDTLRQPCDAHALRRGLVGNLCRCTGYDSIVRAGMAVDREQLRTLDEMYPPDAVVDALPTDGFDLTDGSRRACKPTTIEDATAFLAEHDDATIIAGGTDWGVLENKRYQRVKTALSIAGIDELGGISVEGNQLVVGAAATLTELELITAEHLPNFSEYLAWFGSPPIKNGATLAGNLVTASPIGDTAGPLVALEAIVEIAGPTGRRSVSVEDFHTDYRVCDLRPGELVTAVRIPLLTADQTLRCYKVSRRKDLDISSVSAAFRITLDGDTIDDIRIAFGGVGPTILRLRETEAALIGKSATLETFEAAGEVARDEVTPMTDVRGSETYRRTVVQRMFSKLFHDLPLAKEYA